MQGLLIVVPLLYEYLAARRFDLRRVPVDVLALALVPLGWLAFVVYVLVLVGDPRAIVESRSAWGRQFPPPWDAAGAFFSQPLGAHGSEHSPLDLAFTLFLIGRMCARHLGRVSRARGAGVWRARTRQQIDTLRAALLYSFRTLVLATQPISARWASEGKECANKEAV